MLEQWITTQWQKRTVASVLLLPLSVLYAISIRIRKCLYKNKLLPRYQAPVPVIIIGNINVGGTGKTPLTLALVKALQQHGFSPGIVSRGYKTKNKHPIQVKQDSDPAIYGDEPVLMALHTKAPIFIHRKRAQAIHALCQTYPQCDVILCDDGLQHYAIERDIEIAIIDTDRMFGNGLLLPAGPLREFPTRLKEVDFVIYHGQKMMPCGSISPPIHMQLQTEDFYQLTQPNVRKKAAHFINQSCHALAGIGNPDRFFQSLQHMGLSCVCTALPDHYAFKRTHLPLSDIIFVTEKDAVKLRMLKDDRIWVLPVNAVTEPDLAALLVSRLRAIQAGHYG